MWCKDEAKAADLLSTTAKDAGSGGFGIKDKEFVLGHVEFPAVMGYASRMA